MKNRIILLTALFFMTLCLSTVNASPSLSHSKKHEKKIQMEMQCTSVNFGSKKGRQYLKNMKKSPKSNMDAIVKKMSTKKIKKLSEDLYAAVSRMWNSYNFGWGGTQEKLEEVKMVILELFEKYIKSSGCNFSSDTLNQLMGEISNSINSLDLLSDNQESLDNTRTLRLDECIKIVNSSLNSFKKVVEDYIQNNGVDSVSSNTSLKVTEAQHVDEQMVPYMQPTGSDQESRILDIEQGFGTENSLSDIEESGFFQNILSGLSEIWSKYLSPRASIINVLGMECSRLMFYYVYRPLVCHAYALLPTFSAFVIAVTMKLLKYDDSKIAEVLDRVFNSTGAIE